MMNFIDFEVFKEDWLCVIVNPVTQEEITIINDKQKLNDYYLKHKHELFIGYNIRNYDQFIFKGILLGMDAKRINDKIIIDNKKGFEISNLFNKIDLLIYDVMLLGKSLKKLEAFQGHNIVETEVDFNIDRKLTTEEIQSSAKYCRNDVYELINVFNKTYNEFQAQLGLIEVFKLDIKNISKTQAQIVAIILGCQKEERKDEWDLFTIENIKLSKYNYAKDWFLNEENHDYTKSLNMKVAGVDHILAWGGIHGAKKKYHKKSTDKFILLHLDAESYYPALMIEHDLLSRNVAEKNKYREIRDTRVVYKKAKNPLQAPYKLVINKTYGICKDKNSKAYDPRNANLVCINGQLLLLDLIEKLERKIPSFELIQSNTDGIIIGLEVKDLELLKDIKKDWEDRFKMKLGEDVIKEIWQKDVNNYIFEDNYGNFERKGSYIKNKKDLDYDLPIINEAIFNSIVYNIPVEDTINACDDMIKFQKVYSLGGTFKHVVHNNEIQSGRCFRVFASKNNNDTPLYEVHKEKGTPHKFQDCPEHCFIENENIVGKKVSSNLDKEFYIKLAKRRYESFK